MTSGPSEQKRAAMAAIGRKLQPIFAGPHARVSIPALQLPEVELPQLGLISADLAAASKRWRNAMAPLTAISERFRRQMESLQAAFAPFAEQIAWIEAQERQCEQLELAGWLPHRSSPFHLLEEDGLTATEVDANVADHYHSCWDQVSSSLVSEIDASELDDEAKQCFAEAVAAHGAGLYRCAPRLLFPEIERVARIELHDGALDKMASQERLLTAIGGLTPAEMASTGVIGLRFYRKLTEHLYRHLKDADRVAVAQADPVPNRHAALHGIVCYTSAKSSLNALFVADYLLQAMSTMKRLAREDAVQAPG